MAVLIACRKEMQLRGAARRGAAQGVVRTAEAVDHSCVPSEASERDGAWRAGDAALRDALVVEEANMVAAHRIEERHVLATWVGVSGALHSQML